MLKRDNFNMNVTRIAPWAFRDLAVLRRPITLTCLQSLETCSWRVVDSSPGSEQ